MCLSVEVSGWMGEVRVASPNGAGSVRDEE